VFGAGAQSNSFKSIKTSWMELSPLKLRVELGEALSQNKLLQTQLLKLNLRVGDSTSEIKLRN
jgi:hypothetical protein